MGACKRGLMIAFILVTFIVFPLFNVHSQSQNDYLKINKLLVCENVEDIGRYSLREGNVFYVGEKVYIYLEVEAYGHRVKDGYLYNLTFSLDIINPLGLIFQHANRSYYDVSEYSSIKSAWWVVVSLDYDSYPFAGQYKVIARVKDEVANETLLSETFFTLANGLTQTIRYNLTEYIKITNSDPREKSHITCLYLAIIPSLNPYQTVVEGPVFSLEPADVVVDGHGNTYALFRDLTVPAKGQVTIIVTYTVDVRAIKYLDSERFIKSQTTYPSDVLKYLKPSRGVESDSPELIAVANSLVENIKSIWDKVYAILRFVDERLVYDPTAPRNLSALEAYHLKRGVCEQYARLFTALCRASGIPARVVRGFGLLDVEPGVLHNVEPLHAWAQFYVCDYGWLPVETQNPNLFGLTPIGHIVFVWGEDPTKAGDREVTPTLYSFWYIGGEPKAYIGITYTTTFLQGNITLSKGRTSMKLYAPSKTIKGLEVIVKGSLEPALANIPVQAIIKSPSGRTLKFTVLTDALGRYRLSFLANETGTWIVKTSWGGNAFYYGSQAQVEVDVIGLGNQLTPFEDMLSNIEFLIFIGCLVACMCVALVVAVKYGMSKR